MISAINYTPSTGRRLS